MKKPFDKTDFYGKKYEVNQLIQPHKEPGHNLMWDGCAECIQEVIGAIYCNRRAHQRKYMNAYTYRKGLAKMLVDGSWYKKDDVIEFSIDAWDGIFNHWNEYEIMGSKTMGD